MKRVGVKNTPIEVMLRREVWKHGLRYRLHPNDIPGRPDFANRRLRLAVFVDGCFWHGCPDCYVAPKTNVPFWAKKIAYNRARRARVKRELKRKGWVVVEAWEHEVNKDVQKVARRVLTAIQKPPFVTNSLPGGPKHRKKPSRHRAAPPPPRGSRRGRA